MSVLNQLSSARQRRDEGPNRRLARALARNRDRAGIAELFGGLRSRDKRIQADCVKVLSEVGALSPRLIAPYADEFVALLASRNNRLVWGGMAALATIAALNSRRLFTRRALLIRAIASGSVITRDQGIRTLAIVASRAPRYRLALLPYLIAHLGNCRSQDVPQHAESIAVAVGRGDRERLVAVLAERLPGMPPARAARVRRLIRSYAGPA